MQSMMFFLHADRALFRLPDGATEEVPGELQRRRPGEEHRPGCAKGGLTKNQNHKGKLHRISFYFLGFAG